MDMMNSSRNKLSYMSSVVVLVLCLNLKAAHVSTASGNIISQGQSISGNQTISSSPRGIFELGFFTPGNSHNHYIGIWYKKLQKTVVWVANRNHPVSDPFSSSLQLFPNGTLILLDQSKSSIWSTIRDPSVASNSTSEVAAVLLDNGNFVITDALNSSAVIWQSFDHPTDTWLPGGKLGYNKLTNEKLTLTPWRSSQNPAPGIFSLEIERNGTSFLLMYNGTKMYWTSGPWTGKIFKYVPEIQLNYLVTNVSYKSDEFGSYVSYDAVFPDVFIRYMLDISGQFRAYKWGKDYNQWTSFWLRPSEHCEVYGFCGASSICNQQQVPLCVCLQGFEPRAPKAWDLEDHTEGCVRKTPLECSAGSGENDTFVAIPDLRFPENPETLAGKNIDECRSVCLSDCSCTAFAYDSGCLVWKGDLFNVKQLTSHETVGKELHLRVAASEETRAKRENKTFWIVIGVLGGLCGVLLVIVVIAKNEWSGSGEWSEADEGSLTMFKYRVLRNATKNFTEKLGEGGFGSVFRGTLKSYTAIAVKRLNCPKQADKQFLTEVRTLGKVQHINLVRLHGFCAETSKRFLVYDYMPNGSLESLLFQKSPIVLNWKTRYHIAVGTARGLAYLHHSCRECIIHCDIKPENILLDAEYAPKIADFGLAKLVSRDFSRIITTMQGTRGYIAPEWISGEAITAKADVFSYGMLCFEIISGRRNRDLLDDGLQNYFPTRVANVLTKGEDVDTLLDSRLEGNANKEEVMRACKVACWCIQDDENDRPTMGQVVQLLEGVIDLGIPPIPRFLDRFSKSLVESIHYHNISSGTASDSRRGYSSSITISGA
ncbi:G-type lectin S-receptor-like serine/threonine-protein kinase [Pyrus ussuriensis x Pyrus communis]|uniref:Receptor-like serine/threonine-protein kinase n=1 Tax=Pyrus ussuriensis x Pyrus communis TaxID=2448454 RepID=A0A5N5G9M1_9ROSA|nr:G-type lectin S-receptor-like serine/threonine-protein kinase [Pyrus ussuriensis x Pyrus communis]